MVAALSQIRGAIVTAGGLDLTPLFEVLGEVVPGEFWVLGNEIGDRYLFEPQPDCIISVLAPNSEGDAASGMQGFTNLDVIMRAGRSAERQVPTLVLVPPSVPVPSPAAGATFVSCPLSDKQALKLHLWAFFAPILAASVRPARDTPKVPVHIDTTSTLSELRKLPDKQSGLESKLEELMSNLLQQAGAKVAAAPVRHPDEGRADQVDFAIIPSDDAQSVVLIEVKAGRLTEDRLARAEQQLREYVIARKASLGMVFTTTLLGELFRHAALFRASFGSRSKSLPQGSHPRV